MIIPGYLSVEHIEKLMDNVPELRRAPGSRPFDYYKLCAYALWLHRDACLSNTKQAWERYNRMIGALNVVNELRSLFPHVVGASASRSPAERPSKGHSPAGRSSKGRSPARRSPTTEPPAGRSRRTAARELPAGDVRLLPRAGWPRP